MFLKEETDSQTTVYLHSFLPLNLTQIFRVYFPFQLSTQSVKLNIPANIVNAEKLTLDLISEEIRKLNQGSIV